MEKYRVSDCCGKELDVVMASSEEEAIRKAGYDPGSVCDQCGDLAVRAQEVYEEEV